MNMKKRSILILASLAIALFSFYQTNGQSKFEKGSVVINPGIGLGYWYGGSGFAAGFAVNAEFSCILDDIAIGPYLAITRRSYDYAIGNDDYTYTFIDVGVRGTYHFGRLLKVKDDKFDPYAGAFVGFVATSDNADDIYGDYYDNYGSRAQGGIYAGARWFFSDTFAVFGEVGVGMYPILGGVTIKLK